MERRRLLIGVAAAALLAQAVPVSRSNPAVEAEIEAPEAVRAILRRACYDCHSNETRWPWYAYVAPASWLVASDVNEARDELNFSAWKGYSEKRRGRKFGKIGDELEEQAMPPWQYLLLHGDARLEPAEREALRSWAAANAPGAGAPESAPAPAS